MVEITKTSQDQVFKIEAEAEIADALWDHDRNHARTYFAHAFRAVDLIGSDQPDPAPGANGQPPVGAIKAELRRRIAALIAGRDPALAQSLANELLQSTPHLPSDLSALYPGMAITTAATDAARAADLARAALGGGITTAFIQSLIAIRLTAPQLADSLFRESLAVAASDVDNFGNDLRLLASYVFATPATVTGADIGNDISPNDSETAAGALAASNPELITDFLDFALQTCLAIRAENGAHSEPGLISYAPLVQLLPYYEIYLPDTAAAIGAAFNQLVAAVPDAQERALLLNLVSRQATDQIVQAGSSLVKTDQKDLLYERAALQASNKGELEKALTIAGAISDEKIRQRVKTAVYVEAATQALNKGDINRACRYANEISNLLQQSRVFAQVIRTLSGKKELVRANDVLDNAERQIMKAEDGPDKARALLLLSSISLPIDEVRAMTILQLAVVAINHSDFSDGGAKTSTRNIQHKNQSTARILASNSFSFHQSFGALAGVDFDTALSLAQSIAEREISIRAQIAACRSALQRRSSQHPLIDKPKELRESSPTAMTVLPIARST